MLAVDGRGAGVVDDGESGGMLVAREEVRDEKSLKRERGKEGGAETGEQPQTGCPHVSLDIGNEIR